MVGGDSDFEIRSCFLLDLEETTIEAGQFVHIYYIHISHAFLDKAFLSHYFWKERNRLPESFRQGPGMTDKLFVVTFSKRMLYNSFQRISKFEYKIRHFAIMKKETLKQSCKEFASKACYSALATSFFSSLWGWGSSYISDRLEDVVYAVVCHGRLWWGTFFGSAWPTQKREKICLWPHSELGCSPSQCTLLFHQIEKGNFQILSSSNSCIGAQNKKNPARDSWDNPIYPHGKALGRTLGHFWEKNTQWHFHSTSKEDIWPKNFQIPYRG